jgi:hypothetical protein
LPLDVSAHSDKIRQFIDRYRRHPKSAGIVLRDKPFRRQPRQRLTHRAKAEALGFGDIFDVDLRTGNQPASQEIIAQSPVSAFGQAQLPRHRSDYIDFISDSNSNKLILMLEIYFMMPHAFDQAVFKFSGG